MINELNYFKEYPNTRVTYINQIKDEYWFNWKKWSECTEEEKEKVNLRELFPEELVLDVESKDISEIIKDLDKEELNYSIWETGSRGIHIHIFFYNLREHSKDVRKIIRDVIIRKYDCDISKASEDTLIARCNKPHFKTQIVKKMIKQVNMPERLNLISKDVKLKAKEILEKIEANKVVIKAFKDDNFKDYHLKDEFFKYIKDNVLADNTQRDLIIFPNVAIALAKEGLTEEQIKEIMEPIIKNNFPGKNYAEFNGWVKKALANKLDYNPIQINRWMREFSPGKKDIYNLAPIKIDEDKRKIFITDREFEEEVCPETQWVIDKWLPSGDICFIAGKAASFKTTMALHMAYAIGNGKLLFNTYQTKKSNVLYVNEENSRTNFKKTTKMIKNGLELNGNTENVYFSIMENLRLDNQTHVKSIIECINKNEIHVLFLDSFRRFFVGEENDAGAINHLFNILKTLRSECKNLTIVLLHHTRKDTATQVDMRDALRGSSDIVNSADSIIAVKRKSNKPILIVEHIKNRSGEEMQGKRIKIDTGDNKDKFYFYEVSDEVEKSKMLSKDEECANEIITFVENKNLEVFKREDLKELSDKFSYDVISKALRILRHEGTITESAKAGRYCSYIINDDGINPEKQQKLEPDSSGDDDF